MAFELFKPVALREDLPQYNLRRGDVATVVEHHPAPDEDGYSLEVFNALGETIAVITVPESLLAPLKSNEVLHVRLLESA
ncbi:MAG TPA: DUF4926 domain-containing protein [Oscillatoriaceae cyanobacterium M33_DOE_052]|uniref:DUF4926 domain-containing protein n=1 Tax=Planktothricoides sp. SpSt-374 TaxID=2282167 RepID=A0A7C3VRG9_9CYAN|nr:DUF4926 domain-containing protein [Oscillatoriaceae cyanobacterium M33_DOE_052]